MPVISKNLVVSAVFAAAGLAWLYFASVGEDRGILYSVLFKLGCAASSFALAAQPSAVFEKVRRKGLRVELPKATGYAGVLNLLGIACFALAAIAWVVA